MIPALYAAGIAMATLNFGFARLTHAPFYEGEDPLALINNEFSRLLPVVMGMLLVGVLTAVLVDLVGTVGALALLALVILMPRFAIARIARHPVRGTTRPRRCDAGRMSPRSRTCSGSRARIASSSPARPT